MSITLARKQSAALARGRAIAAQYRDALARFQPDAFGNAFLVQTGSLMGVRETRRIIGDYVLTFEDYIARRSFADEICRNSYFIDVHPGVKNRFQDIQGMKEWENTTLRYQSGKSHGIPYRCLTPFGLKNVLVAGRSISCEQIGQGSVRVMPVCLGMGEAAGAAAAQAVNSNNCDVHAADTSQLGQRSSKPARICPLWVTVDLKARLYRDKIKYPMDAALHPMGA